MTLGLCSLALTVLPTLTAPDGTDTLDFSARAGTVTEDNVLRQDDHFVWGGSVVQGENGRYHMFYARWPHGSVGRGEEPLERTFDGMRGWLKYSEIAYAVSDDPAGPFEHVSVVLKGTGDPSRWDQFTAHNPHIKRFDGRYYLYYVGTNPDESFESPGHGELDAHWRKYVAGQRIGVVVADTLEELIAGRGQRSTEPLIVPDNDRTFCLTTNPSVCRGPDGLYYMMLKSRMPDIGHTTHWIATSPNPEGPFELRGPVFTQQEYSAEDPFVWYDGERARFYAVVKDFSGAGALSPQFGALALVTSEDGLTGWRPANHPLASLRELRYESGETATLAHLERPQLLLDGDGQPLVLYAASALANPFAVDDPTGENRPEHNTFNVHLTIDPE